MKISIIAAIDSEMGIGKDGDIPWKSREDLALFKKTTMGHSVIMGRKTHQSIGFTLKGRKNIVLSRNESYVPFKDSVAVHSKEEALMEAEAYTGKTDTVFIIGGEDIYEMFKKDASELRLSYFHGDYECDTFLPISTEEFQSEWDETERKGFDDLMWYYFERKA